MDRFTNTILKFIRERRLISAGDRITAGLSGGADSTALLLVLYRLRALLGISLCAVHVNHGLRGPEADRDEEHCRAFCNELGIPFAAVNVNVREYVERTGTTEEEAGRILRYEALRKAGAGLLADEGSGPLKIAAAHHADDQAETILFNLFRGSGMKGIGGMQPVNGDLIRPMLCVDRSDIEAWLKKQNISYVTDSTNLENEHTRNKIRNEILPLIKSGVNERAAEHIAAAGRRIFEADRYIQAEAADFLTEKGIEVKRDGSVSCLALPKDLLKEKPQIFRIYVIIEALSRLQVPLKDWGEKHFSDIDRMLFLGKGAHLDLPGKTSAENILRETRLYKYEN